MLASIRNDLMYCLNMLESIEKILLYAHNCNDAEEFYQLNEQLNFNATLNLLANLGETVTKLSPELKKKYSEVSWKQIKDFRNKVVHDYLGLDAFIVYDIITTELPFLKGNLLKIIEFELKIKTFDGQEFEIAKDDFYYRHVPFHRINY